MPEMRTKCEPAGRRSTCPFTLLWTRQFQKKFRSQPRGRAVFLPINHSHLTRTWTEAAIIVSEAGYLCNFVIPVRQATQFRESASVLRREVCVIGKQDDAAAGFRRAHDSGAAAGPEFG